MVLTTLSPVMKLDPEQLAKAIAHLQIETENLRTGVEISSRELQGDIIKQQCETYILDKATAMGLTLEIEIQLHEDGQFPYPTGVVIRGSWTVAEQAALSAVITQDLGIPEERQEWISM